MHRIINKQSILREMRYERKLNGCRAARGEQGQRQKPPHNVFEGFSRRRSPQSIDKVDGLTPAISRRGFPLPGITSGRKLYSA